MTRVNVVPVESLFDQHLMAEYREIPMVVGSLKRSLNSKNKLNIPNKYCLGKGHVSFFYDKGKWLYSRYQKCIEELKKRGYNVNPDERSVDWDIFRRNNLWETEWEPNKMDFDINQERIDIRVKQKPGWYRKTSAA